MGGLLCSFYLGFIMLSVIQGYDAYGFFPTFSKSDSGILYSLIFTVAITNVAVCST